MDLVVNGRSPRLCHDVMYLFSRVSPSAEGRLARRAARRQVKTRHPLASQARCHTHRCVDIPFGSEKKPGTKARPESSSIQSMKTGEGWDLQLDQAAIWNGL